MGADLFGPLAEGGLVCDGVVDETVGVVGVAGIEIAGKAAAGLGDGRRAGCHAGSPHAQTFCHGQAPAFEERGKDGKAAVGVEAAEFGVGRVLDEADLAVEPAGVFKLLHEIGDEPSLPPGKDEGRNLVFGQIFEESAPDAEEQGMVLAGLEGGDEQDVGPIHERLGGDGYVGEAEASAKRNGLDGDGCADVLFRQIGLHVRSRGLAIGENDIGQGQHGAVPSAECRNDSTVAPFGATDWHEIMHQQAIGHAQVIAHPADGVDIVLVVPWCAKGQEHVTGASSVRQFRALQILFGPSDVTTRAQLPLSGAQGQSYHRGGEGAQAGEREAFRLKEGGQDLFGWHLVDGWRYGGKDRGLSVCSLSVAACHDLAEQAFHNCPVHSLEVVGVGGVRTAPDELDIFTAKGAKGCANLEHNALDAARPPVVREMEQ